MSDEISGVYVFSDESGKYKSNNFYIRVALILDIKIYGDLTNEFIKLKEKYGIPLDTEFKFSYLWVLEKYNKTKFNLTDHNLDYFKHHDIDALKNFVSDCIQLLNRYNPKIIVIYTYFYITTIKPRLEIEKDFLQTLMLRIENSCKNCNRFAAIYYDDCNYENNIVLKKSYKEIFLKSAYIKKYSHIKDSISSEDSAYSTGLQLIDLVSGIVHSFLKTFIPDNITNYKYSKKLFDECLFTWIRTVTSYKGNLSKSKTGFIPLYLGNKWDSLNLQINITDYIDRKTN